MNTIMNFWVTWKAGNFFTGVTPQELHCHMELLVRDRVRGFWTKVLQLNFTNQHASSGNNEKCVKNIDSWNESYLHSADLAPIGSLVVPVSAPRCPYPNYFVSKLGLLLYPEDRSSKFLGNQTIFQVKLIFVYFCHISTGRLFTPGLWVAREEKWGEVW
jgi:hypothetical protein